MLVDRQRARLFETEMGEVTEREDFKSPLPRPRLTASAATMRGHVERQYEKGGAKTLPRGRRPAKELYEMGMFDNLIVGCHEEIWREFDAQLHTYREAALAWAFASTQLPHRNDVAESAERILQEAQTSAAATS